MFGWSCLGKSPRPTAKSLAPFLGIGKTTTAGLQEARGFCPGHLKPIRLSAEQNLKGQQQEPPESTDQ